MTAPRGRPPSDPALVVRAMDIIRAGGTAAAAASAVGVTPACVRLWARSWRAQTGEELVPARPPRPVGPVRAAVLGLAVEGRTQADIARELGVTRQRVSQILGSRALVDVVAER